uniref:Uncharacterized protein n=1 Tax=Podoviridae sp. ctZkC8 TaxID=2825259 RepID=A0A8S5UC02_9CAUD|nr:MAG TPA: hypothetical protein [Podoviridae sp. ctZkC8]
MEHFYVILQKIVLHMEVILKLLKIIVNIIVILT